MPGGRPAACPPAWWSPPRVAAPPRLHPPDPAPSAALSPGLGNLLSNLPHLPADLRGREESHSGDPPRDREDDEHRTQTAGYPEPLEPVHTGCECDAEQDPEEAEEEDGSADPEQLHCRVHARDDRRGLEDVLGTPSRLCSGGSHATSGHSPARHRDLRHPPVGISTL